MITAINGDIHRFTAQPKALAAFYDVVKVVSDELELPRLKPCAQ
jgi:hypothetical protein